MNVAARRNCEHQSVAGEDDGLLDEALRVELLRIGGVRGGEHVRARSLLDLRLKRVGAAERLMDVVFGKAPLCVLGERGLQGGRCGDAELLLLRAAASRVCGKYQRRGDARGESSQSFLSTITEVAFTRAVALTPSASPISSTESRVIAAVTRCGPASISTSAITPAISTERITPGNRFLAESWSPVRCR